MIFDVWAHPRHHDYTVACICPMGVESASVEAILDEIHPPLPTGRDQNAYTLGKMGGHNVVIAIMPEIGDSVAAIVATQLVNDFPSIRLGLLVGIGGGVPGEVDIRLGDVVVSQPASTCGGVVQYHIGRKLKGGRFKFERTRLLPKPPIILSAHVRKLDSRYRRLGHNLSRRVSDLLQRYPAMQAEYMPPNVDSDQLFLSTYKHQSGPDCERCDRRQTVARPTRPVSEPRIHYGLIGSVNAVVRDALLRDNIRNDMRILCVEMEAAGLMSSFPCLVIRGICDYADSHKNKKWQGYAALVAAAYAKDLLDQITPKQVQAEQPVNTAHSSIFGRQRSSNLLDIAVFFQRSITTLLCVSMLISFLFWCGALEINTGQQITNGNVNGTRLEIDFGSIKPIGFCLNQAPYIEPSSFVGRGAELQHMRQLLRPSQQLKEQKRLVLGGVGGVGKTQLAIAYARQEMKSYDSIIWMDATSEATLRNSFKLVLERLLDIEDLKDLGGQQTIVAVKRWLSDSNNSRWLLVLDSYDEPTSYDLKTFYPHTFHGSIIITTRAPSQVEGTRLDVKALDNIEHSLQILQMRSQRKNISSDYYARIVAERLGGFPLALASAGAYLRYSTLTFEQYLNVYETQWKTHAHRPIQLPDYQNRNLYTNWDLSYRYLEEEDLQAAQMLKLLAYFGHQSIFIKLFKSLNQTALPHWLRTLIIDPIEFDSVMRKLVDHYFIEMQLGSQMYSMHTCVHDWSLQGLNQRVEPWSYWFAFDCVAGCIHQTDWDYLGQTKYAQLVPHAIRLMHPYFTAVREDISADRFSKAKSISHLLEQQDQIEAAVMLCLVVLVAGERTFGLERADAWLIDKLGRLYSHQGKLEDAEQMYRRALEQREESLGPNESLTLLNIAKLGELYSAQGKLVEAEQMYLRALAWDDQAFGPNYFILHTTYQLGLLYQNQNKLLEAEQMYKRVLAGYGRVYKPEHAPIFVATLGNLGYIYGIQNRLNDAEQMYLRALAVAKKILGSDHTSTLIIVNSLGTLYAKQDISNEIESKQLQELLKREQILGSNHTSTLAVIYSLGNLYRTQGRFYEAEQMFTQGLIGYATTLGPNHPFTQRIQRNLDRLREFQDRSPDRWRRMADSSKSRYRASDYLTGTKRGETDDSPIETCHYVRSTCRFKIQILCRISLFLFADVEIGPCREPKDDG